MKLAVKFVLFVFILFLSTPTIVSLIRNSCDTSVFYSMSEEEQLHKEVKEVKAAIKFHNYEFTLIAEPVSGSIISENLLKHDNITASIFSPPPNV